MEISKLEISNFKAVRRLELHDLGDVVVVAGPNGCGKSCVLDAIRFLKSTYAGYRKQDEWKGYFSELQLNFENPDEIRRLFYDREKPITISADFKFYNSEAEFVAATAKPRILERLWKQKPDSAYTRFFPEHEMGGHGRGRSPCPILPPQPTGSITGYVATQLSGIAENN
jgi:predicted ATP-dependent endonuclease of OLD family